MFFKTTSESTGPAPRQKRHEEVVRLTALSADEFDLVRHDLEMELFLSVLFIGLVVRGPGDQDPAWRIPGHPCGRLRKTCRFDRFRMIA